MPNRDNSRLKTTENLCDMFQCFIHTYFQCFQTTQSKGWLDRQIHLLGISRSKNNNYINILSRHFSEIPSPRTQTGKFSLRELDVSHVIYPDIYVMRIAYSKVCLANYSWSAGRCFEVSSYKS